MDGAGAGVVGALLAGDEFVGLAGGAEVIDVGNDGVGLGAVLVGVGDGVPPVGPEELPLGRADGLPDGFAAPLAAAGLPDVPGAVVPLAGLAMPLAGAEGVAPFDELGDGTLPKVGALVVGVPAGPWFAAGVPLNAPDRSSARRPALAATAAPTATAVPFRRCGGLGWNARDGSAGRDMRSGMRHSSETYPAGPPWPCGGGSTDVLPPPLPRAALSGPRP